ncbi:hypothetical protein [Planctobacterium marinum]
MISAYQQKISDKSAFYHVLRGNYDRLVMRSITTTQHLAEESEF